MYDIIIIGAGPSGLTLAHTCSSIPNNKILIIDSNDSIGGCHRVTRVNGYFTEHGPRIYTSAYKNFNMLLNKMGTSFDNLFTPYNFQITTIGNQTILSTLDFTELATLFYDFVRLMIDNDYGKDTIMETHTKDFKPESIKIIDSICRLTDGADISKYTLNEFLQLANQQLLYQIYQPKLPNDIGLFKIWQNYLENHEVEFLLNSRVESIGGTENIVNHVIINNKKIYGKKIIIATPPKQIAKILDNSTLKNAFGNFQELENYANQTKYIEYVQVTFHWKDKIKLDKVYGFPSSDWGIAYIVLSDYMDVSKEPSQTIISVAITNTYAKSNTIGKSANESDENEIINEMFRVLKISFPNLPNPTIAIFNPNNKKVNDMWTSLDTAFVSSPNARQFNFQSNTITNLYNVGTHNDQHLYRFTTLESAVTNALMLSRDLYPELKAKYPIQCIITIKMLFELTIIVVLCVILIKLFPKHYL